MKPLSAVTLQGKPFMWKLANLFRICDIMCIRFFNQIAAARQKLLPIRPTIRTEEWDIASWISFFIDRSLVCSVDATYAFQDLQFSVHYIYHQTARTRESPSNSAYLDEARIANEVGLLIAKNQRFQDRLEMLARGPTLWPRAPSKTDPDLFPGNETPVVGITEPV
jgi:hypothetical protein